MAKQNKPQKETISRVMHEFKHSELQSGSGRKVRSRKQAVAIALSEAGASNRQSEKENRRKLARTKRPERAGQTAKAGEHDAGPTRAALYQKAIQRGIEGRSRMTKEQLQKALRSH
jgi:hypothetical protein